MIRRYLVTAISPLLRQRLMGTGKPTHWVIAAADMAAAWRRFQRKFGVAKASDYDIRSA